MSTTNVKNANEALLYYSYEDIELAGEFAISGDGAGTYTDKSATFPSGGADLMVAVTKEIGSVPVVVTVTGLSDDATPVSIEGTATIPAYANIDAGVKVTQADSKKFTSVTAVTITGGASGEKFEVVFVPQSDWNLLGFDQGFSYDPGITYRAIPKKFDSIDHYKRIRSEPTFNISELYEAFDKGLENISGRDITVRVLIKDDGGATTTEELYFEKVRVTAAKTFPADGDATVAGTGRANRQIAIATP